MQTENTNITENGKARGGSRKKPAEAAAEKTIHIVPPQPAKLYLRLWGDSPLVVNAFSNKGKEEMRAKQQKEAKRAREAKDPVAAYNGARYQMKYHDGRMVDGFMAPTVKKALVSACRLLDGIPMTLVRQTVRVLPAYGELLPIEREPGVPYFGDHETKLAPVMREDIVRVGGRAGPGSGTADLRYRPEYAPWTIPVVVTFLPNVLTAEQVVNLFAYAGFGCGIGENRPEKTGGSWGCFRVEDDSSGAVAAAE